MTGDTWMVTVDTWHAATLIPIVIISPYKQMKISSYWKAKSDCDMWWVTGDTWHAATLIPIDILNPYKHTKILSYWKAKSASKVHSGGRQCIRGGTKVLPYGAKKIVF